MDIPRLISTVLYILSFACLAPAQNPSIRIDELHSTAVVTRDEIRLDLRVENGRRAPTTVNIKADVLDVDDKVVAHSQKEADLVTGAQAVNVLIPLDSAQQSSRETEALKWARIRYSMSDKESSSSGILSLGAITDGLYDLRLASPQSARPGERYVVRVKAANPVTRQGKRSVKIVAELKFDQADDKDEKKISSSKLTDRNGEAEFAFMIPREVFGEANLTLTAGEGKLSVSLDSTVRIDHSRDLALQLDKHLYQPGQTVHIRGMLFDANRRAVPNADVTFVIEDDDGTVVFKRNSTTNHFGIANVDWASPSDAKLDRYRIRAIAAKVDAEDGDDDGDSSRTGAIAEFKISRYELPTYSVTAKPDRSYYLPDQKAEIEVSAQYMFGKPVKRGAVRVVREESRSWNSTKQQYDIEEGEVINGTLGAEGKFTAHPDLSNEFKDLVDSDYSRFRDLIYAAYVTDESTGRTEHSRVTLRLTKEKIHVYVTNVPDPSGGINLYLNTDYADGSPAACRVEIFEVFPDRDQKLQPRFLRETRTNTYGIAKVFGLQLMAKEKGETTALRFIAVDKDDSRGLHTESLDDRDQKSYLITTEKSIYAPGETIEAEITVPDQSTFLNLDAVHNGVVIRSLHLHPGRSRRAMVRIPVDSDVRGEVTLVAYSLSSNAKNDYDVPQSYRTVLYPQDRELKVTLNPDKKVYRPGENAVVVAQVSGSEGMTSGALGVAIVDKAVLERIRTDSDFGYYGGWWSWSSWDRDSNIGGLTYQDLQKVDATKPLPNGMDLAAEAMLWDEYGWNTHLNFESSDTLSSTGQAALQRGMYEKLQPLLEQMAKRHFPGRLIQAPKAEVAAFISSTGLDSDLLCDAWGDPYQIDLDVEGSYFRLHFTSSGPDKEFGTPDDISVAQQYEDYFEPAFEKLSSFLQESIEGGDAIHDDVTLQAAAARRGSDLLETHDPWGQPYKYKLQVVGDTYWITVSSRGESSQKNDERSWSRSVRYFSPVGQTIDKALYAYFQAKATHPGDQKTFDEAMASAKVPFAKYRDPFGDPFYVAFSTEKLYGDTIHIDVDKTAESKMTPVTRELAVTRILSSGPDAKRETKDDIEVARFARLVGVQGSADISQQKLNDPDTYGFFGAINGVITDSSGAVIPNTAVSLQRQNSTLPTITVTADSTGRYLFRNVTPGIYTLTATQSGFQANVVRDVPVVSSGLTTVNMTLRVGDSAETVEVQAAAAGLQTTSATLAANVRTKAGTKQEASATVNITVPTYTPRLRAYFPETLYWNPSIETDRSGKARIKFAMADNITTWHVSVLASTVDGRIGVAEREIQAFQPFFVEHDPPKILTQGDHITLPVVLRNYLPKPQHMTVELAPSQWFSIAGANEKESTVEAGDSARVTFPFTALNAVEEGKQRVSAANQETGDTVEKSVRVHPDGRELNETVSSLIYGASKLETHLPQDLIAKSLHTKVKIYPNVMSHVLEGIEGGLHRPYGCGEQTISSTYPSLLVLRYYQGKKDAPAAIVAKAGKFLQEGYQRLLNYRAPTGAFTYWGSGDGDASLTAYAIEFLVDAKSTIDVDEAVITKARAWLLVQQTKEGTFEPRYGASASATSYVADTLAQSLRDEKDPKVKEVVTASIRKALASLDKSAQASIDPYVFAHELSVLNVLGEAERFHLQSEKLRAAQSTDRSGKHWELHTNTAFYGWGTAGAVETTALAVRALAESACPGLNDAKCIQSDPDVMGAYSYLIHKKDSYGVWYSGHATVTVLQTLLDIGRMFDDTSMKGTVTVNGHPVGDMILEKGQPADAPRFFQAEKFMRPGENEVAISGLDSGNTLISAQVVSDFYVPWNGKSAQEDAGTSALSLSVKFDKHEAKIGETIACTVKVQRVGERGYGMLLGEIGLPPGAEVERESLDKAMTAAGWSLNHYDVLPDRLIVYVWPRAEGSTFKFSFKPRFAEKALTAPSKVYDYYNPDVETVLAPVRFSITE